MIYYSKIQNAFLHTELRSRYGENWDDAALKVPAEKYQEIMGQLSIGMQLSYDKKGNPIAIPPPVIAIPLDDLKVMKQVEVSQLAQTFIDEATKDYAPAFERESYLIQADEAKNWIADKKAETPVLDGIAAARGIEPDILKVKAFEKSQQYQALCAIVAGQRQAYEDQINAAQTIDSLAAINPVFSVGES